MTAAVAPQPLVECDVCGRELKNPKSRARGRGRTCQARLVRMPMLPGMVTVTVRDGLL